MTKTKPELPLKAKLMVINEHQKRHLMMPNMVRVPTEIFEGEDWYFVKVEDEDTSKPLIVLEVERESRKKDFLLEEKRSLGIAIANGKRTHTMLTADKKRHEGNLAMARARNYPEQIKVEEKEFSKHDAQIARIEKEIKEAAARIEEIEKILPKFKIERYTFPLDLPNLEVTF